MNQQASTSAALLRWHSSSAPHKTRKLPRLLQKQPGALLLPIARRQPCCQVRSFAANRHEEGGRRGLPNGEKSRFTFSPPSPSSLNYGPLEQISSWVNELALCGLFSWNLDEPSALCMWPRSTKSGGDARTHAQPIRIGTRIYCSLAPLPRSKH